MSKKVILYQVYAESENNKILCYFSTREEADRVFYAVSDCGYSHEIFGKKQIKQKKRCKRKTGQQISFERGKKLMQEGATLAPNGLYYSII